MAVLYTLCAGLLTFDNGPATYVGNHYFSAWAGFFISFAVFGSVLKEFLGVGGTSPAAAAETTGGELLKGACTLFCVPGCLKTDEYTLCLPRSLC